jgi:type III secretion system needle length determinant
MNSIESYSPPKATSIDEDSSLVPAALGSDAAALEALRALMGGAANQQPAFGVTLVDDKTKLTPELSERLASLMQNLLSDDSDAAALEALRALMGGAANQQPAFGVTLVDDKTKLTPELSERLASLMQNLLSDDSAPPSLVPLLNSLGDKLKSGGDLANDAEALAQFQTLMNSLKAEPAQSPLTISNTPSAADALRRALEDAFTSNSTRNAAQAKVDRTDIPAVAELPISDVVTLGHSILQSLDSQSTAAAQVSGPATAERIEHVSNLMNEMADRVLVTDPLHGQNAEVRIKIAENIMPGTEVRVWREDGGQLRVEFDTTNAYWARVLNDSTTQLSQRLSERLNLAEGAQVTVQHESGQPQDGRSRNRHTPWELAQQQDNE